MVAERVDTRPAEATRMPATNDLQNLTRDEWEALGHGLCATMYNTERIDDRLGRGNDRQTLGPNADSFTQQLV